MKNTQNENLLPFEENRSRFDEHDLDQTVQNTTNQINQDQQDQEREVEKEEGQSDLKSRFMLSREEVEDRKEEKKTPSYIFPHRPH